MNIIVLVLALFVIAHGLVHVLYAIPRPKDAVGWPFDLNQSWLLSSAGLDNLRRPIGLFLGIVAMLGFVLAGLGLLFNPAWGAAWQAALLIGAAASIVLLVLFWNRMLILGLVIDAALVLGLVWTQSPLTTLVQS